MPGLKRVVADIAEASYADVANRQPALQSVMASAMQQIRDANGGHGRSRLQAGKACRVVDHVVGEENLLPATSLEVSGGGVVEGAGHGDSGKQRQICAIPESVWRRSWVGRLSRGIPPGRFPDGFLGKLLCVRTLWKEEAAQGDYRYGE